MAAPSFKFHVRWKEELVCSAAEGSFAIEMTMGKYVVYAPTEATWANRAPEWAKPYWKEFIDAVRLWCEREKIPLVIDDAAHIWPA